jgi:hypothetical protein
MARRRATVPERSTARQRCAQQRRDPVAAIEQDVWQAKKAG